MALSCLGVATQTRAQDVAQFKHSHEFILKAVAEKMRVDLRSEIVPPKVFLQSQTPLRQFQDAIEPQWGFRPDAFVNAYVIARNEIYLTDDLDFYQKMERFVDDSLAHEFAHFIQVKYKNYDLNNDWAAESEAVDIQKWFRETHMN